MKKFLLLFLIVVAYIVTGKLGLYFAQVNASATAIWAPTGIAIALCLLFGKKYWPLIFIGAFITNFTTTGDWLSSFGISMGNTLEGVIGAYLISHFADGKNAFFRVQTLFRYTLIVIFLATPISANVGVTSLILTGHAQWDQFFQIWLTWWLGDISGALIVTPFILFWTARHRLFYRQQKKTLELLYASLFLLVIAIVLFGGVLDRQPVSFLVIVPLIWLAFRFGRRETISAIVFLTIIGLWGTYNGHGPFIRPSINASLLYLQAYMDIVTLTVLTLAVAVAQGRKAEERLTHTLDTMVEGFQIIDFDWRYLYVNEAVSHQGKRNKEDFFGKTMMEVFPQIESTELFKELKRCMKERVSHQMLSKFTYPNGSPRWFEIRIEPIPEGIFVLSLDVTDRKRFENTLANEKAEDEALLASIGDSIVATDKAGRIILVNKAFETQFGLAKKDVLGRLVKEVLHVHGDDGKLLPEENRPFSIALTTGKRVQASYSLEKKNGEKFASLITATPVLAKKEIIGAVEIIRDVTKEKELDHAKDEFISLASHELRTPLSAIRGLSSMLIQGDYGKISSKMQKPLANIHAASDLQIQLINDLLDVSRIQTGKLTIELSDFPIPPYLTEVLSTLASFSKESGIKVTVKTIPLDEVQADPKWVKQILDNLISNGIKFTQKGSVVVSSEVDEQFVTIFVKDSGVGIEKDEQGRLFEKFRQLSSNVYARKVGSGLGLFISKTVAQKMGGDVVLVKSSKDKGSTFGLSLPKKGSKQANKAKLALSGNLGVANGV